MGLLNQLPYIPKVNCRSYLLASYLDISCLVENEDILSLFLMAMCPNKGCSSVTVEERDKEYNNK